MVPIIAHHLVCSIKRNHDPALRQADFEYGEFGELARTGLAVDARSRLAITPIESPNALSPGRRKTSEEVLTQ